MGLGLKKKTIGFWAGDNNNFQFVEDTIKLLSSKYKTIRYEYSGDDEKLKEEMKKVDLCWFEWGNGPIISASNMDDLHVPIVNRIHRYELYSETPKWIDWQKVGKLFFSSPSMVRRFKENFKDQAEVADYKYLPIGIDVRRFKYKDKPITKELIYVGRIHPHKNPSLLIQIISKLAKEDKDYKLNVIGTFCDELFKEYFFDQIEKQGIKRNVNFLGSMGHEEIVKYLQGADFFLITSIIEGLSQASLEAMACGVRPVIFDYFGSELGYPDKCLYRTVDEAVEMIKNPIITRRESYEIINERYRKNDADDEILKTIKGLL